MASLPTDPVGARSPLTNGGVARALFAERTPPAFAELLAPPPTPPSPPPPPLPPPPKPRPSPTGDSQSRPAPAAQREDGDRDTRSEGPRSETKPAEPERPRDAAADEVRDSKQPVERSPDEDHDQEPGEEELAAAAAAAVETFLGPPTQVDPETKLELSAAATAPATGNSEEESSLPNAPAESDGAAEPVELDLDAQALLDGESAEQGTVPAETAAATDPVESPGRPEVLPRDHQQGERVGFAAEESADAAQGSERLTTAGVRTTGQTSSAAEDATPSAAPDERDARSKSRGASQSEKRDSLSNPSAPEPAARTAPEQARVSAEPTHSVAAASLRTADAPPPANQPAAAGTGVEVGARASTRLPDNLSTRGSERTAATPELSPADRQRFLQRVSKAFDMARHRDGEIRLRLSPPELGSLRLELRVEQGAMHARLEAESAAARQLLVENLPALRERLVEQGIRIEQFEVDLMDRHDHQANHGGQEQPSDHAAPRRPTTTARGSDTGDARSHEPAPTRPLGGRDQSINVIV